MQADGILGAANFHLFPGVELSIAGTHYLAIFDPSANGKTISDLLAVAKYNNAPNNAQGYCEEANVASVCAEVKRQRGILVPAHVDLQQTGLFKQPNQSAVLNPILTCDLIQAMEIVDPNFSLPDIYLNLKVRWASVLGSDSHHPSSPVNGAGISKPSFPGSHFTWVKMETPSLDALRLALHDGNEFSLIRSDQLPPGFDANEIPHDWIESLEISDARLMGLGTPAIYSFNPWMNAVIGGRGSGKSTVIHFLRLAAKRGEDLLKLGDERENRVLRNFNSFATVAGGRSQGLGGLRESTKATLVYRKGGERFRLTWLAKDNGTTVETWDTNLSGWTQASSQDVIERFPLRIFSQDEISMVAERPEALLARVDESIGKAEWQSRWNENENLFLTLVTRIRALRSRLTDKDRLKGQLEDLTKQMAVFGKPEHEKIRKDYQKVTRQAREIAAFFETFNDLSGKIDELKDGFLLHDLPEDFIDPENPNDAALGEMEAAMREGIRKASRILERTGNALESISTEQAKLLEESSWSVAKDKVLAEHLALMGALKAEGVEDPSAFPTLVAKRQATDKSLKEIEGLEKEISKLTDEAIQSRDVTMLELRTELQSMRRQFLVKELGENQYVRISLEPYANGEAKDQIEKEIRTMLNCEDNRFADAIRDSERGLGFVETLHEDLPPVEPERSLEIIERVNKWKQQIVAACRGRENSLPARFQTFLSTQNKTRPEFLDRFLTWWPEDSLIVSYSRDIKGNEFVPLTAGSAGQKAAALLAFFLAHGETPLILDQPENDLDNHLITDLVVSQLRSNKKRRQIIVVTHNPNIVVNGDAEMVYAMNFAGGQCRVKTCGALQNKAVRDEVCDVMEGGATALKSRFHRLT